MDCTQEQRYGTLGAKKKKSSEIEITFSEWKNEIDRLRNHSRWTPEVDKIILYAINNANPLSYAELSKYLTEKYGKQFPKTSVRLRYKKISKLVTQ